MTQQDLSHQDSSAVMTSDWMVFRWYCGDLESFWCGTPRVLMLCSILLKPGCPSSRFGCDESWVPESIYRKYSDLSHTWSLWAAVINFCEGVGEEAEIPDWRGEGRQIPDSVAFHCCSAGQCDFHACWKAWTVGIVPKILLLLCFEICCARKK